MMGALATGWDKFTDYLGRFLMHTVNSTAAGRASHSGGVDGQAFNGPIYPTKRSGKNPPPGTRAPKEDEPDTPSTASRK